MLNRRSLFQTSAAIATVAAATEAVRQTPAAAATSEPKRISVRGHNGIMDRYPTFELESHNDMIAGIRKWTNTSLEHAAEARAVEVLKQHGLPADADLPMEKVLELFKDDPIVSMSGYAWLDVQMIKWKNMQDFYHSRADQYLSEMEAFDKAGPGSLELNPKMHIPGYCALEIHQQPGGYVGDPFAGHMYDYGTSVSADRRNDQDTTHMTSASNTPVPRDGKVRRILDIGTSIGQFATSLKKRFPEAEVWGLDIGGPMVRYAHMRAVDQGIAVNFVQRLAEDSKFPDNHFDLVTSRIMHHEVTGEGSKAVFREAQRILRPGGIYYPEDVYTDAPPPKTALGKFRMFWTTRWNHEDWWMEWANLDTESEMKKAGLKVGRTAAGGAGNSGRTNNIYAIKA